MSFSDFETIEDAVTRPQIETCIKGFIVLLVIAFIYAVYRVADLIGFI